MMVIFKSLRLCHISFSTKSYKYAQSSPLIVAAFTSYCLLRLNFHSLYPLSLSLSLSFAFTTLLSLSLPFVVVIGTVVFQSCINLIQTSKAWLLLSLISSERMRPKARASKCESSKRNQVWAAFTPSSPIENAHPEKEQEHDDLISTQIIYLHQKHVCRSKLHQLSFK